MDIYIVDEEFKGRGGELASHRNFFCEVLREYIGIMDFVCDNIEGETADALRSLVDRLRSKPDEIVSAGINYQSDCESFVSQIAELDSFRVGGR